VSLRNNLAVVLMDKEDVAGALELFRRNLKLRPNRVGTHLNVARCLSRLGRLAEALESYRRACQVAAETGSPHRALAEREAREAEGRVGLERRQAGGWPDTASAGESLAVAEVCHCKQRDSDAVAFSRRAFEQQPNLADNLNAGLRSSAAFAAALAGTGRGEQAGSLDPSGRAELRKQALTWLREELDAWGRCSADEKARRAAEAELRLWQRHPNLAGVRDRAASRLPEDERQAWRRFWADVNALVNAVRGDCPSAGGVSLGPSGPRTWVRRPPFVMRQHESRRPVTGGSPAVTRDVAAMDVTALLPGTSCRVAVLTSFDHRP
jgi:tetratricopeptide (TPR) repeat protein